MTYLLNEPVIAIDGLSLSLGSQQILEDISLTVRRGDWYAIIGPNGGGKTTLIRAILGLIQPDSGTIRVFGCDPVTVRNRIGYVPQYHTFGFDFPILVREMVLSGRVGRIHGISRRYQADDIRAAEKAIASMGIAHLADRPIGALSGGERQRAIIARALAGEPELLLLDEPTVYVDDISQDLFFGSIKKLADIQTILLITHDISVVHEHVTKIACLNKRLYTHDTDQITDEMIAQSYGCPVDLITHGDLPHRVLVTHENQGGDGSC